MRSPRNPPLAIVLLAAAIGLAACGDEGETTTPTVEQVASNDCGHADVKLPKDKRVEPPEEALPEGEEVTATVKTNLGDFEIDLDTDHSPKTASSFAHLAGEGFYDGTPFHRVVDGFVIQGGDPLGTGLGGPGYCVDEPPPKNTAYTEGVVAMAKSATEPPGRSGSQFYVVTGADAGLPPDYAVLGAVSKGMSTIDAIEALADPKLGPEGGEPVEPVTIETIEISP